MAAMWGNHPGPVVQQNSDDVCLPAREGSPDLNAITAAVFESVLRMVSKAVQNDIAAAQGDSTRAEIR